MKVPFKKLNERAHTPTYGSPYSAGADLYAVTEGELVVPAGETVFVHTGIAIELPAGAKSFLHESPLRA